MNSFYPIALFLLLSLVVLLVVALVLERREARRQAIVAEMQSDYLRDMIGQGRRDLDHATRVQEMSIKTIRHLREEIEALRPPASAPSGFDCQPTGPGFSSGEKL